MNPTQHISNNGVLGAPPDWQPEHGYCQALPVTRAQTAEGLPVVVSFWRPSAEDLAQLAAGGLVALHVFGGAMPPVWVEVQGAGL